MMGRICFSAVTLDTRLTDNTIKTVLIRGSSLGFQFYACHIIKSSMEKKYLSGNEAHAIITTKLSNSKHDPLCESGDIDFDIEGKSANLYFAPREQNFTRLSLRSLSSPWCQDKSDTSKRCIPDWNLYIVLLLELCKDFAILELSTYDEYFNWD